MKPAAASAAPWRVPTSRRFLFLSDGTKTNGSDLVRGLRDAVGPDVVLCGGLAGDGPNFGTTYVGLNAPPAPGQVAAIGFYRRQAECRAWQFAAAGMCSGRNGASPRPGPMFFTNWTASRRWISTSAISGPMRPSLPGSALLFPLRIYPADKPEQAIVRTVVGIDEEARTMTFAGDMPEGHCAQLMRGNFDRLIQGAANAAEQAQTRSRPASGWPSW